MTSLREGYLMKHLCIKSLTLGLFGCLLLIAGCGKDTKDYPKAVEPEFFDSQIPPDSPTASAPPKDGAAASDPAIFSGLDAPLKPDESSETASSSATAKPQNSSDTSARLPEALSMYQGFFDGTEQVYVQVGALSDYLEGEGLEEGSEYSLEAILQIFRSHWGWRNEATEDRSITIEYAALDIGDDGIPELAIALSGDMEFEWTLLLRREQNHTILSYSFATWSRSETSLNTYGFMWGGGSNGAGDHSYDEKIICNDGRVLALEHSNFLLDSFSSEWFLLREVISQEPPSESLEVVYTTIGDETYASYALYIELSSKEIERFEALCLERNGVDFVPYEYVEEQKAAYIIQHGILEKWLEKDEVNWQQWKMAEL